VSQPDGMQSPEAARAEEPMSVGSWAVTLALCVGFSTIGAFWLRAATIPELAAGLCEAVPPIPATATLLFLIGLRFALKPLAKRLRLSNAQIIAVYAFVSVSVSIGFINLYRTHLSFLLAPAYSEQVPFPEIRQYVPSWLAPTDKLAVQHFWLGRASVPWSHWAMPLLGLGALYVLFYLVVICMMRILYKRWSQEERLCYPVAELALSLVEEDPKRTGVGSIFQSRVFWLGGLAALLFNAIYIIPALFKTTLPPTWLDANQFLPPKWQGIGGQWQIRFNPIIFGLGYLVSMDVLLSIWVFFLLMRGQAILHSTHGIGRWSLFHIGELQGTGAYLAISGFVLWAARHHIWKALRRLVPGAVKDPDPMEAGPTTMLLFIGGMVGLVALMIAAGIAPWLAATFLGVLLIRVLVTARIRAQAGMPIIYFHVGTVRTMLWLMGGAMLASGSMTTTGRHSAIALMFVGAIADASFLAPHHADAFQLAERSKLGTRRWTVLAVLAVIVGFALVNLVQLPAFYEHGAVNVIGEPSPWRVNEVVGAVERNDKAEGFKQIMAGQGAAVTGALVYLRRFHWFPLHPIGYVIACAIGYRVFAPIFAIWLIKLIILKYFGGTVHRKAKNFFLGLVMGHFFIAAVWAVLAMFQWYPTQRTQGGYFIGFW